MTNTYYVAPRFKGPPGQDDMPYILAVGPVTTSRAVKIAMLVDMAPDNPEFRALVSDLRRDVKRLAGADAAHECVLLPSTSAVESAMGFFAPAKRKKTLVIRNGRDGERAAATLSALERPTAILEKPDGVAPGVEEVAAALNADHDISHVWMCHCETSSGLINPVGEIGKLVKERGKIFMVDATATFGAMPLDMGGDHIDVLLASPERCLEGVPGCSFVIARRDLLIAGSGKSHVPSHDLHGQWTQQEGNGAFRTTPPTHSLIALRQALRDLETEGGIGMRRARYQRNAEDLITRMRAMGFVPLLADTEAGPILQTFLAPRDKRYDFGAMQDSLRQRGFMISAGELSKQQSFRVSCIGQIDHKVIKAFSVAMEEVLKEQDVQEFTPHDA